MGHVDKFAKKPPALSSADQFPDILLDDLRQQLSYFRYSPDYGSLEHLMRLTCKGPLDEEKPVDDVDQNALRSAIAVIKSIAENEKTDAIPSIEALSALIKMDEALGTHWRAVQVRRSLAKGQVIPKAYALRKESALMDLQKVLDECLSEDRWHFLRQFENRRDLAGLQDCLFKPLVALYDANRSELEKLLIAIPPIEDKIIKGFERLHSNCKITSLDSGSGVWGNKADGVNRILASFKEMVCPVLNQARQCAAPLEALEIPF